MKNYAKKTFLEQNISRIIYRNRGGRRVDIGLLGERTDPVKRKLSEYPTLSYPSSNSTIGKLYTFQSSSRDSF